MWDPCSRALDSGIVLAPTLERIRAKGRRDRLSAVPYFAGFMAGETDALIGSFAGEPELHHPVRGGSGARAFERFVVETNAWLAERNAAFDDVDLVVSDLRTVEEVVLRLDGNAGRVELPVAIAADRDEEARLIELRIYFSTWPLTGGHVIARRCRSRSWTHQADVIGEYQRARSRPAMPEAAVATFELDGYVREPAGGEYVHRGHHELRSLYERFFSNGGGIPLEHCTATDDGRAGPGVQRRPLGPHGAAAGSRDRRVRPKSDWQAGHRTHLRRLGPAAGPARVHGRNAEAFR